MPPLDRAPPGSARTSGARILTRPATPLARCDVLTADETFAVFARAREIALDLGHDQIGPLHLTLAVLATPDPLTADVLRALRVDAHALTNALRRAARPGTYQVGVSGGPDLAYTARGARVLHGSRDEAGRLGHRVVHPLHVLLAVLAEPTPDVTPVLAESELTRDALQAALAAEVP